MRPIRFACINVMPVLTCFKIRLRTSVELQSKLEVLCTLFCELLLYYYIIRSFFPESGAVVETDN